MRIFVCVKQVPDTSGTVAVNEDGTLNRASMATIINPDDLIAMEQEFADHGTIRLADGGIIEVVLVSGARGRGLSTFAYA